MRFLTIILVLFCAGSATPAFASPPDIPIFWDQREQLAKPDLSTRERVLFLTTTDFPPFSFLDAQGRLSGFHVELARAICRELKIVERCQIQALPWDELDPALQGGRGEALIAGVAVTAENRARYAFTRPYLRFPGRFVAAKGSGLAEPLSQTLIGKRVGVVAGSAHEKMLTTLFPGATSVAFPTMEASLDELRQNKLDAVLGDGVRLAFWLSGQGSGDCCAFAGGPYLAPQFLGEGLAIAVKPQDADLAQAFDFALREVGVKGTFAELYLRYFPVGFY